ncbi:MAG: WYL domain-containing protein [Acidimicrobiales bacterium]|nr:WYL domain-containing protein [Acidimicrobiales bacterium]
MARVDRFERLTNLVLVLLDTPRPMTLQEIADSVAGYPEGGEARRQAFERDKHLLRQEGVVISVEPTSAGDRLGYRIRPDDYYLPDLALSPEEQAALNLAVAGIHLSDGSGPEGLLKLGILEDEGGAPVAFLPSAPSLALLHQAIRDRASVRFAYRGGERVVDPYRLLFRGGWWYLIGHDHQREAARTFRVDRMESEPVAGPAGGFEPGVDLDPVARVLAEPWRFGEGETLTAEVAVDPLLGAQVVAELGEGSVVGRDGRGGVTVRLEVTNTEAFRSWLVGLLDHAEVLGPPALRQDVREWLSEVAAASPVEPLAGRRGSREPADPTVAAPAQRGRSKATSGARSAPGQAKGAGSLGSAERLRLLLAVLPWLAARGRTPTAELAGRLGLEEPELVSLLELAACCGLPPYTPDRLMELIVEDGWVTAGLGPYLARPRRLSAAEGFALAASARAILAVPGSDPDGALARALDKLETVLGAEQPVSVELDEPELLAVVRDAAEDGRQLEVEYYAASTDEVSLRRVDPDEVFTAEGHWYLDAYCHLAQGQRHFRVDRILSARPVGRATRPGRHQRRDEREHAAFVPGPETREVVLLVPPTASWVAETFPVQDVVVRSDGRLEVTLPVSRPPWLARLLLRLGPEAVVLHPADLASVGREAAAQILARYRDDDTAGDGPAGRPEGTRRAPARRPRR